MILIVNNSHGNKKSYYKVLIKVMKEFDIPFHVMTKYDKFEDLQELSIKGVILSGGPIKLTQNPNIDDIIMNYRAITMLKVPILGICFGCQILHNLHGGILKDLKEYTCQEFQVTLDTSHFLFKNCKEKENLQFCFSDLIVPIETKALAWFEFNNKIHPCAFDFGEDRYGTMFHPEFTPIIIKNFIKYIRRRK